MITPEPVFPKQLRSWRARCPQLHESKGSTRMSNQNQKPSQQGQKPGQKPGQQQQGGGQKPGQQQQDPGRPGQTPDPER